MSYIKNKFQEIKYDINYICTLAVFLSFFGWVAENIIRVFYYGIIDNRFHILPFIPVYGFLSFALYIFGNSSDIFKFKKTSIFTKIISNTLYFIIIVCGVFFGELIVGNLWEHFFGVKLWDYSDEKYHLTQYVSLMSTIGYSTGAFLIIKLFYFPMLGWLKRTNTSMKSFSYLYLILIIDMIVMTITTILLGHGPVYWQINLNESNTKLILTLELLCVIPFVLFFIIFIATNIKYVLKKKKDIIPNSTNYHRFAILIAARDESSVIDATLDAIYKSNYPRDMIDTYVMVSDPNDKTLDICKKYEYVISRVRKTTTVGKGYVLDELIKEILVSSKTYDYYMVLDADNIISSDFIRKMNNAINAGYDVVVGNRNNKDWNASSTSAASCLTFTIINHTNKIKSNNDNMVLLTGTGFVIKSSIINELNGWPFTSLTEDYELSKYASSKKLSSYYEEEAIFYDEQPISLGDSIKQRTRWVKGFLSNNKGRSKNLKFFCSFGMIISLLASVLLNLILLMISFYTKENRGLYFMLFIQPIILYYFVVVALSLIIFYIDRNTIKITKKNAIKSSLFHPLFLATYIIAFFRTFKKGTDWEKIEHKESEVK